MTRNSKEQLDWLRLSVDWGNCQRCSLGSSCANHVLGRGHLPADWLFLGLAPGYNENRLGTPYAAAEGRMVKRVSRILSDVLNRSRRSLRISYGYLLACRPVDSHGNTRSPSKSDLLSCWPRVMSTLDLLRPKGVVTHRRNVINSTLQPSIHTKWAYYPP